MECIRLDYHIILLGYCCGRKCGKEESNVPYTDAEYEYFEQRQLPARPLAPAPALLPLLQHTDKRPAEETVYAEPILVNNHVNTSNPLGKIFFQDTVSNDTIS